jgi:hypothetical protein
MSTGPSKWWSGRAKEAGQSLNRTRTSAGHTRFIDVVIVASGTYTPTRGSQDIANYLGFVEESVQSFLGECHPDISHACDSLLGQSSDPAGRMSRILDLCATVVECTSVFNEKTSVYDIAQLAFDHYKVAPEHREHYGIVFQQLVFACLGWTTMLYTPSPRAVGSDLSVLDMRASKKSRQMTGAGKRSLGTCLRALGVVPLPCPLPSPETPRSTTISASNVDYTAIKTLCNVSIEWVNDLSSHCQFDPAAKKLYIFRFPSRCALDLTHKRWSLILHRSVIRSIQIPATMH